MGLIVRALLAIASLITSWFIAKDALKFQFMQMVITILLITLIILCIVFWPEIKKLLKILSKPK